MFLILPGLIECLQVKKNMCSQLTFIKQYKTLFFMLPTQESELRCLMNWKDFKCSWIIKSSERRRREQSGHCARLADQEDLPVLSVRRNKTSQNPPPEVHARSMLTQISLTTIYCTTERHSTTTMTNTVNSKRRFMCVLHDALIKNQR